MRFLNQQFQVMHFYEESVSKRAATPEDAVIENVPTWGKNANRNFSLIYQKITDEAIKSKMKIIISVHFYVKGRNIKLAHLLTVKVEYVVILGGFFLDLLEQYYY